MHEMERIVVIHLNNKNIKQLQITLDYYMQQGCTSQQILYVVSYIILNESVE